MGNFEYSVHWPRAQTRIPPRYSSAAGAPIPPTRAPARAGRGAIRGTELQHIVEVQHIVELHHVAELYHIVELQYIVAFQHTVALQHAVELRVKQCHAGSPSVLQYVAPTIRHAPLAPWWRPTAVTREMVAKQ